MSIIEVTNEGETLKIDVTDSTTASDVIDILNAKWSGCAKLALKTLDEITRRIQCDPVKDLEEQKRKQKEIDRIAWKAEAAQRLAKGRQWK